MNTNDFYELKKSYDTSQMPEKEVIKMKEKMNQAKAEKKNKHNKTIITRIWVGAAAAIAAFVILPNTSPSVAYAMEQRSSHSAITSTAATETTPMSMFQNWYRKLSLPLKKQRKTRLGKI